MKGKPLVLYIKQSFRNSIVNHVVSMSFAVITVDSLQL